VAYGISVTTPEGIVCAGGSDARGHLTDVYRLSLVAGEVQIERLPPLPQPCANASGALVGQTLYISGGIERPDATTCLKTFWSLDLSRGGTVWGISKPCPGKERMLAVAGSDASSFYLFSGTKLTAGPDGKPLREYLCDAWRYRPAEGWKRVADLPRPAVAAPSPAPRLADGRLLVISGDDGTKIGFKPESEHPGFPRDVLAYDPVTLLFDRLGEAPFTLATAPTTAWRDWVVIPNGEARPGYRSPAVWGVRTGAR
jgi:N-acetylneuraminic acid mutarotase